jgi:transposase
MMTELFSANLSDAHRLIQQQAELVREQKTIIARQAATIRGLEERVVELEQQLDEAKRAGKRQATPFSKGRPKGKPKKPGQKKGHPAVHRPPPERIDREEEAPLPSSCPKCGGAVSEEEVQVQYQVDIPRPIPTVVTQFNVHIGYCEDCGCRLQGRHPQQSSDALGAAAVQVGPNAIGLASEMKHELGVSYDKAARLLSSAFGLTVNRSTLTRADGRLARKLKPTYQCLILRLRQSEVAHADETGWKIGGQNAWLWVFTNDSLSVYVIDPHRGHEVAERILGKEFEGVLGCDCFLAYDPLRYRQSKCVGHLLRRCHTLSESKSGRAIRFSQQVARLLRGAIALKARRTTMSQHGYAVACGRLEAAMDRLLAGNYTDPDNARLAKLLRKQRDRLFTFLYVEAVAPTNNIAEREIRPSVIIRKTNGCNRSETGAQTHSIITSVIRTCRKHGHDFVNTVKTVLLRRDPIVLEVASDNLTPPTPLHTRALARASP